MEPVDVIGWFWFVLPLGVGVLALREYRFAKTCFFVSAALLGGKVVAWSIHSHFPWRGVVTFALFGTIGLIFMKSLDWVDKKRDEDNKAKLEAPAPSPVPTPSAPVKSPDYPAQPNPASPQYVKTPGDHKERPNHAPQMFTEQETKFYVTFGTATLTVTDKYPAKYVDGVRAYVERGRVVLDAQLFSGSVNPVEVKANQLSLKNSEWDRNYDDTALEVVNQNGVPVLQVIYTTPHNVVVHGVFQTPDFLIAMSQD
jgi:hypothetical protein